MNTALRMAKISLRQMKVAYFIVGLVLLLVIVNDIVLLAILGPEDNGSIAVGDYLYLLPLLMAVLIPALHFPKLMHLGGKSMDFFKAAATTYLLITVAVTLVSIVLRLTLYPLMLTKMPAVISLLDVFGFWARGPVVAFFQMSAFLMLFCCVLHTLTLIQGRWYGWLADVLLIAIISVFAPIAPLRAALGWFFNMIIFHDIAIVQIASCVLLGAAIYCASLIPIKSKQI